MHPGCHEGFALLSLKTDTFGFFVLNSVFSSCVLVERGKSSYKGKTDCGLAGKRVFT